MTAPADATLTRTTVEIWWRRLVAYLDEASVTLVRTAFSRTVTDAGDFSCALFDARGRMIAQPSQGLPAFIGCLAQTLADVVGAAPAERWREGDSHVLNDPWRGTGQLNDLTLITPVFAGNRLVAFAASVAHAADLGGRILSADSRDVFEEGLRIPLTRAFVASEPNPDLFDLLRVNSRVPEIVLGDLQAQQAANHLIVRRLTEFLAEEGLPDLGDFADRAIGLAEEAMRSEIARWPDGTHAAEVHADGFDRPIRLAVSLTIRGDEIEVDYAGSSPQDAHAINCCWNYTYAETVFPLICAFRPAGLINAGTLRPIRLSVPEGTVLNPRAPAALGSRVLVSQFLQAAVFRALAEAMPERVVADCGTPAWLPILAGTNQHGGRFVEMLFLNGGFGARPDRDGISCLGWPASFSGTPVELTESEKPIRIVTKELSPDSGGAGTFRGGLGQVFEWTSLAREPLVLAVRGDRVDHPPLGMRGGHAGAPARFLVNGVPVHSKRTILIAPGDTVRLETPGSGGYGDPAVRPAERVSADVEDGYVSPGAAASSYGRPVGHDARAGERPAGRGASLMKTSAPVPPIGGRRLLHSLSDDGREPPVVLVGGSGSTVWDAGGRRYLDGMSGVWNVSLGYGRSDIARAAGDELETLAFASTYAGFANAPALRLAEKLAAISYDGLDATFFTVSGADANEAAIKTARFAWRRRGRPRKVKILGLEHGFYGMTLATTSAGGMAAFRDGFGPRLEGFVSVPSPYPYRCDFARPGEDPASAAARRLAEVIEAEGADTIAALIIEPVQGSAGVIVPPHDYFQHVRRICDRNDVLLISDEVITGFGRTGEWFGLTHWDVAPDIMTFGKGASSGYLPLGGMIVGSEIADLIRGAPEEERWMHSSTFSGHPACCAAGLRTIAILEDEGYVERVAQVGSSLRAALDPLLDLPVVGEVRGLGLLAGVELVADRGTRRSFPGHLRLGTRVKAIAQELGLLVRSRGDTINLAPPFVVTAGEVEWLARTLGEAISRAVIEVSR